MTGTALPPTLGLVAALALAGCAGLPAATPGAATASGAAATAAAPGSSTPAAARPPGAAASAVAATTPGQPPAFVTVIKDARRIDGLIPMYQRDEKFWFELRPEDFGRPFFLSPKLASGIGEGFLLGGLMQRQQVVEFRRIHNQVQLVALNTTHTARPGTPESRAVGAAFSPSLLGSAPVASQPHPERKTVLVDAVPLFVNDMLSVGMSLARSYRQNYSLDRGNSAIRRVRSNPDTLAIETTNHYSTLTISLPSPGAPPTAPQPSTPRTLPDPRSLFVDLHYSLAPLPVQPMAPRLADARVGHFIQPLSDYSDDLARTPRIYHIARWRLEKKDPAAPLSEPVKPITYWIDRNVPLKYRDAIRAGVLEWNKAFERIGFKDAIRVEIQRDDAAFDTLDYGVASIRWMSNANASFAGIGPSHVDPRSGEILDADIAIEGLSTRSLRSFRSRTYTEPAAWASVLQLAAPAGHVHDPQLCQHAEFAAEQLAYGLDVLAANADLDPAGAEAEAFVQAHLKDLTMHEVGHTLGLRHNFRASRIRTDAQLSDPEFTKTHALTGSVMEYAPINLALPGEKPAAPFQTTLGPYDYWAVEYAYKPLAPEAEAAELRRIAARSTDPELAYGTDEDQFLGIDPESLHFDLGSDPLAFARKRLAIAQDLFRRQEQRTLDGNGDYGALRRSLQFAVIDTGRAAGVLMRQIGGLRTLRDHPGSGRDPLQPLPAAEQRAALEAIARGVFAADSLVVSPALARRLAPDYLERTDAVFAGATSFATDYPLAQTLHAMRAAALTQLLGDTLATRLLDAEGKVARPDDALRLLELYRRLDAAIWSELADKGDIPAPRRELQREHANRLAAMILKPTLTRADARSTVRTQAADLLARIDTAAKRPGLSEQARLHLKDSGELLRAALAAPLLRAGG